MSSLQMGHMSLDEADAAGEGPWWSSRATREVRSSVSEEMGVVDV